MAKTHRLTNANRDVLKELMERVVDCPAEASAEKVAYEKAAPLVRKIVEAKFPPADMSILSKYEAARKDKCVYVNLPDGDMKQFRFRDEETVIVPSLNCSRHIYLADERAATAVTKWFDARETAAKALNAKQGKYRSFINTATTFEQVVEIWPEAMQVSDRISRNLPVALNEADLADIAKDSKRRLASLKRAA